MLAIIDELYPTTDTCNSSTVARLKINLTRNRLSITSDLLSRWLDQLKWVECTVRSSQSSGFDSHLNFFRFSINHLGSINCMRRLLSFSYLPRIGSSHMIYFIFSIKRNRMSC